MESPEAAEALARSDVALGGQMRTAARRMQAAQLMRASREFYSPEQVERLEASAASAATLLAAKQASAPATAAAFETLAGDLQRPLHRGGEGLGGADAAALALELRRFLNLKRLAGDAHPLSPSALVDAAWCAARSQALARPHASSPARSLAARSRARSRCASHDPRPTTHNSQPSTPSQTLNTARAGTRSCCGRAPTPPSASTWGRAATRCWTTTRAAPATGPPAPSASGAR